MMQSDTFDRRNFIKVSGGAAAAIAAGAVTAPVVVLRYGIPDTCVTHSHNASQFETYGDAQAYRPHATRSPSRNFFFAPGPEHRKPDHLTDHENTYDPQKFHQENRMAGRHARDHSGQRAGQERQRRS